MKTSTELYHDDTPFSSRTISVEIENGLLRIDLQDIWKNESHYGFDEYERCMYNIDANHVMALFNVISSEVLLEHLKVKFRDNSAFDNISKFLIKNNIKYDYYSD